ncbi:MAG: DUF1440 domain-containing protein [Ignavibacteriaceae bacterium]|jgi:uncharacterized membrane protein YagU involved in acid resistance|nr:DUF1440 domain-containing protein [Ignavibacteriaceae bacterium]
MKSRFSIQSVLIAGIAGTAAMTLFTYMAPLMGFEMNIPGMLAGTMKTPIIFGWITHFMIGIVLAFGYAVIFLPMSKKEGSWKSGAIFGLIPWLMAQIMVMPMMMALNGGSFVNGLFSGSIMMAMASLVGHLIFGAVLGRIYKPETILSKATA